MRNAIIMDTLITIQRVLDTEEASILADPKSGPNEVGLQIGAKRELDLIDTIRGMIDDHKAFTGPVPREVTSTTKESFLGEPGV